VETHSLWDLHVVLPALAARRPGHGARKYEETLRGKRASIDLNVVALSQGAVLVLSLIGYATGIRQGTDPHVAGVDEEQAPDLERILTGRRGHG
jgi:hypothetical protein